MQTTANIPAHERGKIGAAAATLGLGHKADDDLDVDMGPALPEDELLPMPETYHATWTDTDIEAKERLSLKLVELGRIGHANLLRSNLDKPKSNYFRLDGLEGMVKAIERYEASLKEKLDPIETPTQYHQLIDIVLIVEDTPYKPGSLPAALEDAIIETLNAIYRAIGRKGYAKPYDTVRLQAPYHIRDIARRYSCICGAAVRFIRQYHYLKTASRKGNNNHHPMTFARRLKLVEEALQQLGDYCHMPHWTLTSLKLVTPAIKQLWEEREAKEPLPRFFARTLFEFAAPDPCNLSEAELLKDIQQHPDMEHLEACRKEFNRRKTA